MGRRFARAVGWSALWGLTLVSFAPVLSLLAAIAVADLLGCPLDEGSVHPCLFVGVDIGAALYTGAVLGWLAIMTLPAMAFALIVWAIVIGRALFVRLHRRREDQAGA